MLEESVKTKNKLLPLREIAVNNSFSLSYASLLVQRKVLRAKKVGRNYFTTQEWFNEYLKNHARNDRKVGDPNKKLMPLRLVAEANSFSAGYVSILVQRKVLRAKKVGRNYFTTQEWFNEYLKNHSREESALKTSANQPIIITTPAGSERAKAAGRVAALDIEELSNKITDKIAALSKDREIQEEVMAAPRKRFWAIKFLQAAIAIIIIAISGVKLFPAASYHLYNLANSLYLSPVIKLVKLINPPANKNFSVSQTGKQAIGEQPAEKGRVAGASEINLGFTSVNEEMVSRQADEAVVYFKSQFKKLMDFLDDNFYKFYLVFSGEIEQRALTSAEPKRGSGLAGQTSGQGAVIVPFKTEEQAQEIKQKVESMFSDQVVIEPGETPREGIVRPVFGAEPADQKYLYMMVPVTESKNKEENK